MTADSMVIWLRSALDHVEQVAREAVREQAAALEACGFSDDPAEWDVDQDGRRVAVFAGQGGTTVADGAPGEEVATMTHIALHDPRAVLARVEADRAVVSQHVHDRHGSCALCYDRDLSLAPPGVAQNDVVPWPCPTLRWLAYGHRFDIEGYDMAWAPEGVRAGA